MNREDIESLIGENMEDMGLVEHIEEKECSCGELLEDDNKSAICYHCQKEIKKLLKDIY